MSDDLRPAAAPDQPRAETHQELERRLRYRQLLRDQLDQIVGLASTTVATDPKWSVSRSQLSNVITVAQESRSIPVVVNYLKYQMGRTSDWKEGNSNKRTWLGHAIIAVIERDLLTIAQRLVALAAVAQRDAHLDVTVLYLGYLRRVFIAENRTKR